MGNWVGWTLPEKTNRFIPFQKLLITALSDLAPVHRSLKDKWGWGQSGAYSIAHGFLALQTSQVSILSPAQWKSTACQR